ncbi:alpha/beta hydrolase [Methanomethylovorans sp.]|uniref:alpha/beta hydrolase n=1 Tax=Methanomethylovorans sp. TaxID=2758717 RepID=UPI00351C898A
MKKNKKIKGGNRQTSGRNTQLGSIAIGVGVVLIITGVVGILHNIHSSENWSVSDEGKLSYDLPEKTDYSIINSNTTESSDIVKLLTFKSKDNVIQSLMHFPSSSEKVPGIVVLPGAGVTKEEQQGLASELVEMGYATITIDQRNQGAVYPETDLELFKQDKEPVEYSMVYDVLMAAEVLRDQKEVDSDKIAMLGISNGGRFAIIATALDPKIKGVVGISTSGYQTNTIDKDRVDENTYFFYRSIDPDTYITTISPRKVVMFHATNDTIVPYSMAEDTFELASEPKTMYTVNGTTHGYSPSTKEELKKELAIIFNK